MLCLNSLYHFGRDSINLVHDRNIVRFSWFHYLNHSLILEPWNIIINSYNMIVRNFRSIFLIICHLSKYNIYYQWPTWLNINSNNIHQLKQSPQTVNSNISVWHRLLSLKKTYFLPSSHFYKYLHWGETLNLFDIIIIHTDILEYISIYTTKSSWMYIQEFYYCYFCNYYYITKETKRGGCNAWVSSARNR